MLAVTLVLGGGTHDVDHGGQEVDEDGQEDDDVAGGVGLVDPAAALAEGQRQTLVVLRRGDEHQAAVQQDEHRELDHHGDQPVDTSNGVTVDAFVFVIVCISSVLAL